MIAFSSGDANVVISQNGSDYLTFGTAVWGPNWSWAGIEGKARAEGDTTVADLKATVAGKAIDLAFRAERLASNRLQLNYQLKSDSGIDLDTIHRGTQTGNLIQRNGCDC